MKRKIFSAIFVLTILLCVPIAAGAQIIDSGNCGASGDNVTWALDDTGTLTISGEGEMKDYRLAPFRPWNQDSVTRINISGGITNIGGGAFTLCENLMSVDIAEGVKTIDDRAFDRCFSLTEVNIPSSINNIGANAFDECVNLLAINVNDNNQMYYSDEGILFNKDMNILIKYPAGKTAVQYNIPDNIITIGYAAFKDNKNIKNIISSSNLKNIEDGAFASCTNLYSIDIPNGVTYIGKSAFRLCENLVKAELPDSVTFIGSWAFDSCSNLLTINIPFGVQTIGERTFSDCKSLDEIDIPNSVTSIGLQAFIRCESIKSIDIPNSVTSIDSAAFYECKNLASVRLSSSMNRIGHSLFAECSNLSYVIVPDSITTVSAWAFMNCNKLRDVDYLGSKEQWSMIDISDADSGNNPLINATIHYNTTAIPTPEMPVIDGISYENGECTFTAEVENIPYTTNLISVLYDQSGAVAGITMTEIKSTDTSVPVTVTGKGAKTVKVFIWDSITGMKPLCEAAEAQIQ